MKAKKPCPEGWESADPGAGAFTPNPCVRCGWSAEDHARIEILRSALMLVVEKLKGYVKHESTCEIRHAVATIPDGAVVLKEDGSDYRQARCTCGLDDLLATLPPPHEKENGKT